MYKGGRKLIIWIVMTLFLVSLWPVAALGADNQTTVSLDQAIRIVKQNFTIPTDYSDFSSGFNSSDNRQSWSLNWSNPARQGGNFSAQVNAVTGEVISMNCWKSSEGSGTAMPTISVSEARNIASRLLKQLIPQRFASLNPLPENQIIPLTGYGQLTYTLRWERLANNIPVTGDGASVEINLSNGDITSYNLNWSNLEIPASDGAISNEQASQVFIKNGLLKLQYHVPTNIRPLADTDKQQQPILVYNIADSSNGIIDALTGTPVKPEPGQWLLNERGIYDKAGMGMGAASSKDISNLTPEEEKEITQTANLISKDAAVAAIDRYIGIPSGLELQAAHLDKDWQNPGTRIWTLQWNAGSSDSSPSKELYARVNARTGELISFNLYIPPMDDQKPDLSREAALKIAQAFIKKVCPQHVGQIKMNDTDINSVNNETRSAWSFDYQRVVNGINCPGNGININIDRVSKQVTSFDLNWSDREFPAAANILGTDKANQLFLQGLPLTLTYITVYGNRGPQEIRLVYQPQNSSGKMQGVMINAQTGDWLDNEGQPVSKQVQGYIFNDIAGHFAEKEIALLGQAGLFGEYGTAFHPNENITLVSLLRAMLGIRDGAYYPREQTDQEIMNQAKSLGWLQKDYSPSSSVDREMMARLITHYLDLDYLVRVPQLFQITFKDSAAMSQEFKGYAALTWGLGIIKGNGTSFEAKHVVTRAEAATYLARTIKAKSQP